MHFEAYRDYARRGFFELLVVTVLCLGMILGLRWLTARRTPRQVYALNALGSLTVVLALVMLASALQRLMVWESVQYYISSPTRLYVRTFIIWLAMTYGWLLLTLWLRHDRFAVGAASPPCLPGDAQPAQPGRGHGAGQPAAGRATWRPATPGCSRTTPCPCLAAGLASLSTAHAPASCAADLAERLDPTSSGPGRRTGARCTSPAGGRGRPCSPCVLAGKID